MLVRISKFFPSLSLIICELTLFAIPSVFAITTFHRKYTPSVYLGLAIPVLVSELLFILFAFASGMRPIRALLEFRKSTIVACLVFLLGSAFVGLVTAPLPRMAQIFLIVTIIHLAFAFSLADSLASAWRNRGEGLLVAAGWGAALYCVFAFLLLLTLKGNSGFDWKHIGVGVSNVRQLAFFGLTSAAVGAGLTLDRTTSFRLAEKWRNWIFLTVGSGLCIWSGGRAAVGALILMLTLALRICIPERRRWSAKIIGSSVLTGVLLSLVWIPDDLYGLPRIIFSSGLNPDGADAYSSGRIRIWAETISFIHERPFLGYGVGQFKFIVPSAMKENLHPHNAILQIVFQWGFVGLAALTVMIWPALKSGYAVIWRNNNPAAVIATLLLVAHLFMSMFEGNLFHVYPTFIVILSFVTLRYSGEKRDRTILLGQIVPTPAP